MAFRRDESRRAIASPRSLVKQTPAAMTNSMDMFARGNHLGIEVWNLAAHILKANAQDSHQAP